MFLGKIYRKKRSLPLYCVRASKKKPPTEMSHWSRPVHHATGIEHLWYQSVINSHSSCCGCGDPVRHFTYLAERYGLAPGPRAPGAPPVAPVPSIRRARPAPAAPEPRALPWHGDGGEERGAGGGDAGSPEADFADDGLDALVAALDEEQ